MTRYRKYYPSEVEKELERVRSVANSDNRDVKLTVPHYLILATEDCVVSSFGRDYAKMLVEGDVFRS